MPTYLYKCPICKYEAEIDHPMIYSEQPVCENCGLSEMVKKPQVVAVNWNGLKPSAGVMSPAIKKLIDDAPRRRDNETPHQSNRTARLNQEALKHGLP